MILTTLTMMALTMVTTLMMMTTPTMTMMVFLSAAVDLADFLARDDIPLPFANSYENGPSIYPC